MTETTMAATSVDAATLNLTKPVFLSDEIRFSAFGPGWGFCAYSLPAGLVIDRLGAANASEQQLNLAFQVNRQRITQAVVKAGMPEAGKRIILLNI
jgi:hypothetical protein